MHSCPYCDDYSTENLNSLRIHCQKGHDKSSKQLRIDLLEDGKHPMCECGCGQETSFNSLQKGFSDYVRGHHVRDSGGFYTEEGLEKSAETRRKQFREGNREPWNKGLTLDENPDNEGLLKLHRKMLKENNPERARKISESLSGREISENHRQKITEHWRQYWSKEKHRKEQRVRRAEYHASEEAGKPSQLEIEFGDLLDKLGFDYEHQVVCNGFAFDYMVKDTYIEVHGDFYHANPEIWKDGPEHSVQEQTVKNDRRKKHAVPDDKDLLVFWEKDINENGQQVMKRILNELT